MRFFPAFLAAAIAVSAMVYAVPLHTHPLFNDNNVSREDAILSMKARDPQQAEISRRWGPAFLEHLTDRVTRCFVCKPKVKVDKFQAVDFTAGFHPRVHPTVLRIEINQELPRLFKPTRRLAKKTQNVEDVPYLFLYHKGRGPVLDRVALEPVTTQINQKKVLLAMGGGRKSPLGVSQTQSA